MIQVPVPAAVLSPDRRYRYFLSRQLAFDGKIVTFVGLNPSTADATQDDPTIRRCMGFAASWGARELWMVNLFAYRDPKPTALAAAQDPIGPDNDKWLDSAIAQSDVVVAAWGNHATLMGRSDLIRQRYQGRLTALKVTARGMPSHPLYMPSTMLPTPYS
jgi:hypothetical protein